MPGPTDLAPMPGADAAPTASAERATVDLARITWLLTAAGFAFGMLILLLEREWGYGAVSGTVAISAAINLF